MFLDVGANPPDIQALMRRLADGDREAFDPLYEALQPLVSRFTDRMLLGGGVLQDPKTLKSVADNIAGRTICAFGEACAWPTQSFLEKFPDEFAAKAEKPLPPPLPPEYTPDELITEKQIPTVSLARDPGWEKAGAAGTV